MSEPQQIDSRYLQLIDRLLDLTQRNSIEWQKAARRPSQGQTRGEPFSVNLTKTTVRLRSVDNDGVAPFALQILDEDGILVAGITSRTGGLDQGYIEKLSELYRRARRSALDVDKVIDSVLTDLAQEDNNSSEAQPPGPST